MKLSFLGNGSGFTNSHTNAYFITKENNLVLIDLSMIHYETIMNFPLHKFNNIYVLVTHNHDDHTSGIGMFAQYCYYVLKKELIILAPYNLLNILKENLTSKGIPENIYEATYPSNRFPWFVNTISVEHAPELKGECFGYVLNIDDTICIYSGDTNSIEPLKPYIKKYCELYLDVSYSYGGVHIKYDDVKEDLISYANDGLEVILMHLDDIESIKRVIKDTKLKIAEIKSLNYYSNNEICAIKNEVCFNKTDIINMLNHLLEDTTIYGIERINLEKLLDSIEKEEIKPIIPDFTKKEIEAYVVYVAEGTIVKTLAKDFYFKHDDENKELYCASFSWAIPE